MAVTTRAARPSAQPQVGPDDMAVELVAQLARRMAFEFASQLAPLGLTPAQFAVMDFLFGNGGSATQAEIARSVGVEQPTMAATLRRMERDGLVARVADPSDGRQSFVSPTAAVKRKRSRLAQAHQRVEATMTASLNVAEQVELKRLLLKLQSGAPARKPQGRS